MKQYQLNINEGIDSLKAIDVENPKPGPGEVLVKVKSTSLNYRDTIMLNGGYPRNEKNPVVPFSDMAGEVVEAAEGSVYTPGDRVMANFLRDYIGGEYTEGVLWSGYGGGIDGFLQEYAVVPEKTLIRVPNHLSFEEAATLPCAAVTAWNALTAAKTKSGDTVLLLGTGGVSIFALQLAKSLGARVIITTSKDEKGKKARELGADEVINYKTHPEWHEEVRKLTNGRGVDHVIEVGGPGTLERSLQSVSAGGTISLIGLLDMPEEQPSILPALLNAVTIRGIYVGSVEMFETLNRALSVNQIKPVIDKVFEFDQAREALEYLQSQKHLGKVVINVS